MQEMRRHVSLQDAPVTEGNSEGAPNGTIKRQRVPGARRPIGNLIDDIRQVRTGVAGAHLAVGVTYRAPRDCRNTNLWDLYM